jgi:predicted ester cyclase
MAVIVNLRWAGVRPEQYDEVREVVGWETDAPKGGIHHCAAFDGDGAVVTDVWETAEDFENFVADRLMPGVHKVGILGEPRVEILPAHALFAPAYRTGPGATTGDTEAKLRLMFDTVVNQGRTELMARFCAPGYVTHLPAADLDLAAFTEFVAAWRAAFPDLHCSVENVIRDGDRIAWTVRATGTHLGEFMGIPATGRKVDFLSINEGRADADGAFAEHWVVMDQLTMLQQLGVVPALPA